MESGHSKGRFGEVTPDRRGTASYTRRIEPPRQRVWPSLCQIDSPEASVARTVDTPRDSSAEYPASDYGQYGLISSPSTRPLSHWAAKAVDSCLYLHV